MVLEKNEKVGTKIVKIAKIRGTSAQQLGARERHALKTSASPEPTFHSKSGASLDEVDVYSPLDVYFPLYSMVIWAVFGGYLRNQASPFTMGGKIGV